jgi:leucyl-tRNA synthetase
LSIRRKPLNKAFFIPKERRMSLENYNYEKVEKAWQNQWFTEEIFKANKKNNKKFFIHFAYPGVSGYLHVGHMRGFTYCDIIARYKRMTGFDVLFPAGFHASGIPSIGFAKKVERKDPMTLQILNEYGVPDNKKNELTDPENVVEYFANVYVKDYWKKFGFLIDYSRIMSTISEGYKKFIEWQFHKLKEKELLVQKPHFAPFCPNCGPVAVDKSETDISKGGNSEILEFTVIKFKLKDGTYLPAATLRPETIFGVTNMWVNPDVNYEKVKINDETWIVSKEAIEKLSFQYDNVKLLNEKVNGKDLVGKSIIVPLVNREVPILSGPFADPCVATGIVMSVPAHAPYDWIALVDSKTDIEPITIIDVKGYGKNPAKQACENLEVSSQSETEKLDLATEEVYKKEFHTGVLNQNCQDYAGIKISEIKDQVKDDLKAKGLAREMREFSEEVICRCSKKVLIKQIPDQWFIKYSDYVLTSESKEYTNYMNIFPQEYKDELPKVLDWFDDRACIRKGSWLGTEFPFKKGWIIEPISDSTLYPAYYIISNYVNQNKIKPEDMTVEFFDYVFLSKGKAKSPIWKEIKQDFDYWYPVDINLGGKEHKTVHFPVFLMNHVAIMPEAKRPRGIFVHWWVTQKGKEKISKQKGGAEPILEAASKYGVDAMRLYYSHVGSPFVDIEWDSEAVTKYKNRIANTYKMLLTLEKIKDSKNNDLDRWFESTIQRTIKKTRDAFEKYDLRIATNEIFFECLKKLSWYLKRGGANKEIIDEFKFLWLKLMTPISPHLAEEFWHKSKSTFISNEMYPEFDESKISEESEIGEDLISSVADDINEILKVTKIKPKRIIIYTSPSWKTEVFKKALIQSEEAKINIGELIKESLTKPELKNQSKLVSNYISKLPNEIRQLSDNDKRKYQIQVDEKQYLKNSMDYLEKIFSCKIEVFKADESNIFDPAGKTKFATPLRPAIYIE